ncbi:GMC family oxidoreductase [bacterium]|nr:GMC family oxidoreductase [bacterium]
MESGLETEVAVVGSGVSGALAAWKLAQAGRRVLLIEAGPSVDRAEAVRNFAARENPDDTYPAGPDQPRFSGNGYFEQAGPEPFTAVYEKLVGGTTWHWSGTCLRFLASDFRLRTLYGVGQDWPIGLSDLLPYYAEAERELGVAGSFLPPLPPTYLDRELARAAQRRGYRVEVLPAARNSVEYDGRPACRGSATCFPICPIGAKYDASVHVRKAVKAGALLWSETPVLRLLAQDGRVTGLECRRGGEVIGVQASLVLLAANAIESPRLLLHSGIPNPWVGRFLMGMAGQVSRALAPRPVWPFRSPQVVSGITQFRDGAFRRHRAGMVISVGNDGWPDGAPPRLAGRLVEQGFKGQALQAAVREHVSRQLLLVSSCEELPRPENRVELSDQKDGLGVPRPRLHYKLGRYTLNAIDESVLIHARIFDELGASQIHHYEQAEDPAHLAGTCRMGEVVDAGLRSRDWSNLYVLGSSVFPTCGTAPPTLTVAALTLRCVEMLAKTRSS